LLCISLWLYAASAKMWEEYERQTRRDLVGGEGMEGLRKLSIDIWPEFEYNFKDYPTR
jgi:hypothetical protein